MVDIFKRLASGNKLTGEVQVFTDAQAVHDYRQVEKKLNTLRLGTDPKELEQEREDVLRRLKESRMVVHLEVPDEEVGQEIYAKVAAKHNYSPEIDMSDEDYEKFNTDVTDHLLAKSIVKIETFDGTREKALTVAEVRKLRKSLMNFSANWFAIVDKYQELHNTRIMDDLEFRSVDFS